MWQSVDMDPISEIDMRLPEDHDRLGGGVRRRNSHHSMVMVGVTKKWMVRELANRTLLEVC